MLLDFYGELLTDKQRECFDLHYNEDLSLAEIAEQLGVSRQGVWDNIRRAETAMEDIEAKTGLLRRFEENRRELESLLTRLEALTGMTHERRTRQEPRRKKSERSLREGKTWRLKAYPKN